ncbi:hypothetical protein JOB18_026688 [Solea senegalensis]|uniref:DUF4585 domain-containing protein n=2 Tax=Solea senegalensis TaxID=28829 RepID=A0AAV6SGQ0_SOLSE|nr:hypothetical protein JOB18_026688 [Solea senegalensis]
MGVSCPFGSSHRCVFTPSTLHPYVKVNYKPCPLNYVQPPSAPTHLLERSEESPSEQPDHSQKPRPLQPARTTRDKEGGDITVTPPTQTCEHGTQQHGHNPPCRLQGFLPAQVGGDFLVAGPGAFLSGPAPFQVMLEPQSGRCYYVDTPPQHQRKILMDPETGQFFQVLLPTTSPAHSTHLFPMCCVNPASTVINPAPTMLQSSSVNPSVLSVMPFQPMASSLCGAPCLPFTMFTPATNFTLTSPQ